MNWGPKTDLGLYGSSYVGMLGAIVRPTDEPRMLQIDCLATDFFRDRAYPTFLYFNPHAEPRRVAVPVGTAPARVYDAAAHQFITTAVTGEAAVLAVLVRAAGLVRRDGPRLLVDDVTVDYAVPHDAGPNAED